MGELGDQLCPEAGYGLQEQPNATYPRVWPIMPTQSLAGKPTGSRTRSTARSTTAPAARANRETGWPFGSTAASAALLLRRRPGLWVRTPPVLRNLHPCHVQAADPPEGIRADWVVGTGSASDGLTGHLVYAMRVTQTMTFDDYFVDHRFQMKKPNLAGSRKQAFGDNIYHRNEAGFGCSSTPTTACRTARRIQTTSPTTPRPTGCSCQITSHTSAQMPPKSRLTYAPMATTTSSRAAATRPTSDLNSCSGSSIGSRNWASTEPAAGQANG